MPFELTDSHLAAIGVRQAERQKYLAPLQRAMNEFGITFGERPAMFLAQIAHESGRFRYTSEIWGPTKQQLRYDDGGSLSRALGNHPGEGYARRGFGLIQVTGRFNQQAEADFFRVPFDDIAKWLQTPEGACRSAAHFWASHGCNELADRYDFVGVTKVINGGTNGLAERVALYEKLASMQ